MRGKRRDPRQDYAGVYYILNTKNGRIYVGQSVRIFDRQDTHRSQLTHGKHRATNSPLSPAESDAHGHIHRQRLVWTGKRRSP